MIITVDEYLIVTQVNAMQNPFLTKEDLRAIQNFQDEKHIVDLSLIHI